MSQKTEASKLRFPDPVAGERAVWPRAPTEPHRCDASDAPPRRAAPAAALQSPCLGPCLPGRVGRVMEEGRGLPEAAYAAPQVPATDATGPSN